MKRTQIKSLLKIAVPSVILAVAVLGVRSSLWDRQEGRRSGEREREERGNNKEVSPVEWHKLYKMRLMFLMPIMNKMTKCLLMMPIHCKFIVCDDGGKFFSTS